MAASASVSSSGSAQTAETVVTDDSSSDLYFCRPCYPAGNSGQMPEDQRPMTVLRSMVKATRVTVEPAPADASPFPDVLGYVCCHFADGPSTKHLIRCGTFEETLELIAQAITKATSPQLVLLQQEVLDLGLNTVKGIDVPCFHKPSEAVTDADVLQAIFNTHVLEIEDDVPFAVNILVEEIDSLLSAAENAQLSPDDATALSSSIHDHAVTLRELVSKLQVATKAACAQLRAMKVLMGIDQPTVRKTPLSETFKVSVAPRSTLLPGSGPVTGVACVAAKAKAAAGTASIRGEGSDGLTPTGPSLVDSTASVTRAVTQTPVAGADVATITLRS